MTPRTVHPRLLAGSPGRSYAPASTVARRAGYAPPQGFSNQPIAPAQPGNRSTGSSLLLGFAGVLIVVLMARPFDVVLTSLHLPMIICGAGVLAVLATGAVRGLNTRTGRLITALVLWMTIVSPFSIWKGGSAQYLKYYVLLLVVLFLAIAESPKTVAGVKKLMQVLGVSVSLAVVLLAAMGKGKPDAAGSAEAYRSGGAGMFGNEGEFALLIGFVLPFWVYFASTIRNKVLRLLLMSTGSVYLLWLLVMTGTRSAFVALVPVCLLLLVRLSMARRVMLGIAAVVVCGALVAAAPQKVVQRLMTLWVPDSDNPAKGDPTGEAAASAEERKQLVWDGIQTMITNPIFGVGPGNFADYRFNMLHKRTWFPAHNTYVQFGAESGVIGAVLYILFLLSVFVTIQRVRKRWLTGSPESVMVNQMLLCLQTALVFYTVMSGFQNCDRYPHLFIIAGLATALERLTNSVVPAISTAPAPLGVRTAFRSVSTSPPRAQTFGVRKSS